MGSLIWDSSVFFINVFVCHAYYERKNITQTKTHGFDRKLVMGNITAWFYDILNSLWHIKCNENKILKLLPPVNTNLYTLCCFSVSMIIGYSPNRWWMVVKQKNNTFRTKNAQKKNMLVFPKKKILCCNRNQLNRYIFTQNNELMWAHWSKWLFAFVSNKLVTTHYWRFVGFK